MERIKEYGIEFYQNKACANQKNLDNYKQNMRKILLLIACYLPILLIGQSEKNKIASLDAYIEQARQQWEAPGIAVAIVKEGKVLLSKGYGVKSLVKKGAVNQNTIFGIGSTTKAMVTAVMGMLVDEGIVHWDDKVIEHMPEFQLYDPYVTRELRIRDLLTHNAGLGNADFLWLYNDLSSKEILHQMRYVKPAYSFRGGYTYQNIMYLAAGELMAKVTGKPWAELMQERLFSPLGMTNTYASLLASQKQQNRSTPHHYVNDQIVPIADCSADPVAPAGAIWSSVEDMSKWMRFMLDSAKVNGARLLEEDTYLELLRPQVIIPASQFYPTTALTKPHWTTYGLGWFQHEYKNYALSFHTGSLPGTTAIIGLIPEENLGVYVLGNLDHAEVRHAIMYKVIDTFISDAEETRDWSTDLLALYTDLQAQGERSEQQRELKRIDNTAPSKTPMEYTGTYYDLLYGEVEVLFEKEKFVLKVSSQWSAQLTHWHFDTYNAEWSEPWMSDSLVSFQLDENSGAVGTLKVGNRSYKKID